MPELPEILTGLGLDGHIGAVVNSAVTGYEKPHPRAFRLAQEKACWPRSVWMIGDNPAADYAGAVNAEIRAILVRTPPAHGELHVPDLSQLIDVVSD